MSQAEGLARDDWDVSGQGPGLVPGRRSLQAAVDVLRTHPKVPTFAELKGEYAALLQELVVDPSRVTAIDRVIDRIVAARSRYEQVSTVTTVPWEVIATVHNLEASLRFDRHLHNGDPLTGRTVHVPAGRPVAGTPPFTWEESAADALAFDGFNTNTDWSAEKICYMLEGFNGWGYRWYHPAVKTPYLWSFSNQYTSGKYGADGAWDPNLVSDQIGGAVLLKRMDARGIISLRPGQVRFSLAEAFALPGGSEVDAMLSELGKREGAVAFVGRRASDANHPGHVVVAEEATAYHSFRQADVVLEEDAGPELSRVWVRKGARAWRTCVVAVGEEGG